MPAHRIRPAASVSLGVACAVALVLLAPSLLEVRSSQATVSSGTTRIEVLLADYGAAGSHAPLEALVASFEEANPEYDVELRPVPYLDLAREALDLDAAPALVNYPAQATFHALRATNPEGAPLYTPIDEAMKNVGGPDGQEPELFVPALLSSFAAEGRTWAYPLRTATLELYANQRELREAGVKRLPDTWDELASACRRILGARRTLSTCLALPNSNSIHEQYLAMAGDSLVNHSNGRAKASTRARLAQSNLDRWIDQLKSLQRGGALELTSTWKRSTELFTQGRAAFTIDSSQGYDALSSAGARSGFGVEGGPVPSSSRKGSRGTPIIGDSLWLRDGLDDPVRRGALAFVRHIHSARSGADLHMMASVTPSTRAAISTLFAERWFGFVPQKLVPLNQLASPRRRPSADGMVSGGQADISGALEWAVARGVTGRANTQAVVRSAQRRASRAIAASRRCRPSSRGSACLAISTTRTWAPFAPPMDGH